MSPLIREYAALVPFDPVQYVWIDFASAPPPSQAQSDVITERLRAFPYDYNTPNSEWPLPFEDMCILLPLVKLANRQREGVLVTTLSRRGDDIRFQLWSNSDKQTSSVDVRSSGCLADSYQIAVSPSYALKMKQTVEECQRYAREFFRVAYRRVMSMSLLGLADASVARATAPKSFINAKRIQKGKRPFFEWTTVVVEPRSTVPEPQPLGGTHASPKPHMRRGYVRRSKTGKLVTVKSTIVNKHKMPDEGFMFHDYRVENPVAH